MKVKIWFDRSNVPITYEGAISTYQKGDLFCVGYNGYCYGKVDKYPLAHIFKISESEFFSSQPSEEDNEG